MPRYTLLSWWCGCKERNEGSAKLCAKCGTSRIEKHAQIHASERAVVYLNPMTGERRTPARADQNVPEVYARQGFERHEIMNMTDYEKRTGVVHEATNFNPGNEPSPVKEPERKGMPQAAREALINEVREAMASGPWTDDGADHSFAVQAPV